MQLQERMMWVGNDSTDRTQKKLKAILSEAFEGKYTTQELSLRLRSEFEQWSNIEAAKLEAAIDFHLRQGRNLGVVSRAIEQEDDYLQVVAKIDERTTNICRSMHLRVIPLSHLKKQYNSIIQAKSVDEAKTTTNLSLERAGAWSHKLPANLGIPPYHFGCRTILRQMSDIQVKQMKLDEFGREYEIDENITAKLTQKHLKKTSYRSVDELLRETMGNISREGVHHEHGDRRTILGSNGVLVVLSRDGKIITAFPPDTDSTKYYDKWTAHTYFDKVEHRLSLLTRIQKWLGL